MSFSAARRRMVEEQLIARGIASPRVLDAFLNVERHVFVPEESRSQAYEDHPVGIGEGQTISQPYIVALMTEALGLRGDEKVLEIGTGSGYQTAILARLCREVFTVERITAFSDHAQTVFTESGIDSIHVRVGDGTRGWPEEAPFDRIIVTAYCRRVPQPLIDQLRDPGKLVIPLGDSFSQNLTLLEKKNNRLDESILCPCVFVPLVGEYGIRCV